MSKSFHRAILIVCAACMAAILAAQAHAQDDALSRDDRILINELTARHMPELVEELLARRSREHRVHVARAYAHAAINADNPSLRASMFDKAATFYRQAIALADQPHWPGNEKQRFDLALWHVELGDLIVRYWIAADLDRYEITSGLDYNRHRLLERLEEANRSYKQAADIVEDLLIGVRTDEEAFLLLGIADDVEKLDRRHRINHAWAQTLLGMLLERDPRREGLLESALSAFDAVARTANDEDEKYNALLGAGIALRELGRHREAASALDRVERSTAAAALTARARYEFARTMIAARRYDSARRALTTLAELHETDAGFHVRLAPLVHAYTYIHELKANKQYGARAQAVLRNRARRELDAIASHGGVWADVAEVYLGALPGGEQSLDDLSDNTLLAMANRAMREQDYGRAMPMLTRVVERSAGSTAAREAAYNLSVCHFQSGDVRKAAERFTDVASGAADDALANNAAELAYQSWRRVAAESQSPDDYRALADAARRWARRTSDNDDAREAEWVAALALHEAGAYQAAITAYLSIRDGHPRYWNARRNLARCRQALYESLSGGMARRRAADAAVDAWLKLADDLAKADGDNGDAEPNGEQAERRAARLAAASLMATDDIRDYNRALALLEEMPASAQVLGLKIRCHRARGDQAAAKQALDAFLERQTDGSSGAVLLDLAVEMETELERLQRSGRELEMRRLARSAAATLRELLVWMADRDEPPARTSVVRLSLANALVLAGETAEAASVLDALIASAPDNGQYILTAARLHEKIADAGTSAERNAALDRAESLWARLLCDAGLRTTAPEAYWEARYHWLRHQLRHGRAKEVVEAIEAEQAWHPRLGGPPWQARLLDLRKEARAAMTPP